MRSRQCWWWRPRSPPRRSRSGASTSTWAPDVGATPPSSFAGSNIQLDRNNGFTGLGSLGYAFGNGFRLELEGSYRQNGLHSLSGTYASTSASGNIYSYGA